MLGLVLALSVLAGPAGLAAQKPTTKPAPSTQVGQPAITPIPVVQPAGESTPAAAAPPSRYAAADALADSTPDAAERSVAALAAYLAQVGPDELMRTRALFRWVAGHIAYDVAGFRSGSYGDLSPGGVLRSRSSVCEGYARLTEALGTAMGLQVQVVSGWSKGYGFTTGQRVDGPTNHAWNAVRIGGAWRLLDPTWGAGYLDQHSQFVRRFQEHYFLTPPEAFVFDHLPQDSRWQLLEHPISSADYENLVYLRPMFFLAGLRVGSRPHARITASGRTTVTLGVTQAVQLMARLWDAASNRLIDGELTFVQVGQAEARIDAVFPRAGDYLLRVFAKPGGAEGVYDWALDYRVQATAGAPGAAFPMSFGGFGSNGATLFEPMTGVLPAGRSHRFRLRVPRAQDVAALAGQQWTHFTRDGEDWVADVPVVPGDLTVMAKYDGQASFTGLLKYTGR